MFTFMLAATCFRTCVISARAVKHTVISNCRNEDEVQEETAEESH